VTHAIGDRANHVTLDAYERALRDVPSAADPRLRIEHAQVLRPDDVPRFARLGIIASMQPPHATSDMPWAEERLGPRRIRFAYAWRSILQTGAHLPLSSDFPGETPNPFYGMYAAETRQTPQGEPPGGWFPRQRLTRREVLEAYTREAAYAGFQESSRARIAPGLLADLVVLSGDILTVPPKGLLSLHVLQTYVDGRKLYDATSAEVD
jgi:predicted amidohydrolase YtcJ